MITRQSQSDDVTTVRCVPAVPTGRRHIAFTTFLFCSFVQSTFQFSMQEYRPPVKTSVKKIHSDRTSAIIHNNGDVTGGGSPSHYNTGVMRQEQQQKRRDGDNTNQYSPPSSYRRRFLSTSSKAAHAGSVGVPSSQQQSSTPSFERRMRDLVLGQQREEAIQQPYQEQQRVVQATAGIAENDVRQKGPTPANVKVINSVQEYKEIVGDEQKKPVIVRFFATYCKACMAVAPYFYKMAREKSDDAIFVDVPLNSQNTALHRGLGIPSLPYVHIYHPEQGLVEEMSFTRKHVTDVVAKLNLYIHPSATDDSLLMNSIDLISSASNLI